MKNFLGFSKNKTFSKALCLALMGLVLLIARGAKATEFTIDFSRDQHSNDLRAGQIIDNEFNSLFTIDVQNFTGPDIAIIFDSSNWTGADPDLQTPSGSGVGNAATDELGNILIIAEDEIDTSPPDGFIDDPDDEGSRPAGVIAFNFQKNINSFGFHLIDIENGEAGGGYFAAFYDNGSLVGKVPFTSFTNTSSKFYDASIQFGNNSINEINPILASELGSGLVLSFDRVDMQLGGSGAIDSLTFNTVPTPEPATLLLLGSAMVGLASVGRKKFLVKDA